MTATTTKKDRRKNDDRRSAGDRRRGADKRYATIEVCPDELRLVLTIKPSGDSKPLLVTRTVTWRKQSSSLLTVAGRQELSQALVALSNDERLSGCETIILLGGAYCVTRTASGPTGGIDRQLRELEERGQLYLSLGVGQVSMAKRQYPLDARHVQGLLSIANQLTINCVAEAAHEAGLSLKRVESTIVSLCRAHRMLHPQEDHPVLLVNLFEGGLTLGVADQGRLLLEYMPGGAPRAAETAEIVSRHLSRIQRFCGRQHVGQTANIQRVYLCGSDQQISDAMAGFSKIGDLELRTLAGESGTDLWESRSGEVGPGHAAALGGAAAWLAVDGAIEGPNLLEKWIRESRKHLRPILLRSAAPLAAVLLAAVSLLIYNAVLTMNNGGLRQDVAKAEPTKARHRVLRLDLTASESKLSSLLDLQKGLPPTNYTKLIRRVGNCLPDDVWLERLAINEGAPSAVYGAGYSESGVYEFVSNLGGMPGASNVALQETGVRQSAEGPSTSFNLTTDLSTAAGASTQEASHE